MNCPYCGDSVSFRRSSMEIYGKNFGPIYICQPCEAWVGCHPGTVKPLGQLANRETRRARMAAHQAFDPLWKRKQQRIGCSKKDARTAGYKWLAQQLGIPFEKCHIGMFDAATCKKVVELCSPYL